VSGDTPATWTEAQFQSHVISLARQLGWGVSEPAWKRTVEEAAAFKMEPPLLDGLIYHTRWSMGSESGWPDLVLIRAKDSRILFRELKTDKGKVSLRQQAILDLLRRCGMDADVWRPSDLDRIGRELL
jgi:hypothetical protein